MCFDEKIYTPPPRCRALTGSQMLKTTPVRISCELAKAKNHPGAHLLRARKGKKPPRCEPLRGRKSKKPPRCASLARSQKQKTTPVRTLARSQKQKTTPVRISCEVAKAKNHPGAETKLLAAVFGRPPRGGAFLKVFCYFCSLKRKPLPNA